jgi:hypothetical protein
MLLLTVVLIFSCSDEDVNKTSSIQSSTTENFQVFSKDSSGKIDYSAGFSKLYYNYHVLNNGDKSLKNPTVYFGAHTDVMEYQNGDKAVVYPIIENGRIKSLLMGILENNGTNVRFEELEGSQYDDLKNSFVEASTQKGMTSKSGNCPPGTDGPPGGPCFKVHDIPGVVITVPKPTNPVGPFPGGGCGAFGNCGPGVPRPGGGAPTGMMAAPPPPDLPINDIKKFLNCLDASKSANLTVYAAEMFSSSKSGHAFISITQGSNTLTFGFYPKTGLTGVITGPGVFGDDGGHAFTTAWNVGNVTPAQLQNIIATVIAYSNSNYDLGFNNCVDFTIGTLNNAGINFTAIGVDTPSTFSNSIKSSATGTNGNAPQTKGCK